MRRMRELEADVERLNLRYEVDRLTGLLAEAVTNEAVMAEELEASKVECQEYIRLLDLAFDREADLRGITAMMREMGPIHRSGYNGALNEWDRLAAGVSTKIDLGEDRRAGEVT